LGAFTEKKRGQRKHLTLGKMKEGKKKEGVTFSKPRRSENPSIPPYRIVRGGQRGGSPDKEGRRKSATNKEKGGRKVTNGTR